MRTLPFWARRFAKLPVTIECARFEVQGPAHWEPPLLVGPGHINVRSRTRINVLIHGKPSEDGDFLRSIREAYEYPDDIHKQLRVTARDYDGIEWTCGYLPLKIVSSESGVVLVSGDVEILTTMASGHFVASDKSIEVLLDEGVRIPLPMNLEQVTKRGGVELSSARGPGATTIDALGTQIEFAREPGSDAIWVNAAASTEFYAPFAEGWICEPFSILLGHPVYPRMSARNRGDQVAQVSVLPSPSYKPYAAAMLGGDPYTDPKGFWELYTAILKMVATSRSDHMHPVTAYYQELYKAASGSHWVLCMTLASVVEGLLKLLQRDAYSKAEPVNGNVELLLAYIRKWDGNSDLKNWILNSAASAGKMGTVRRLKQLVKDGVGTNEQVDVWRDVRNRVMHGELVSPWDDYDLDSKIAKLFSLVHAMTRKVIETGGRGITAKASRDPSIAGPSAKGS